MDQIYKNILDFRNNIEKRWWSDKITQESFQKLNKSIKDFNIEHKPNLFVLYKLYDTILGEYSKIYIPNNEKGKIRNNLDSLYKKLKIDKPKHYFNHIPTMIFNQFIKGITYFENENPVETPYYHRLRSCGLKGIPLIDKFENPNNKYFVKKCYVERTIYNMIYMHFLHYQDIGHLRELHQVEKYYQQYFLNDPLFIHIDYDKNHYPYKLTINSKLKEVYTKHWDKEIVMCQLRIKRNHFSKINTFKNENPWVPIKLSTFF